MQIAPLMPLRLFVCLCPCTRTCILGDDNGCLHVRYPKYSLCASHGTISSPSCFVYQPFTMYTYIFLEQTFHLGKERSVGKDEWQPCAMFLRMTHRVIRKQGTRLVSGLQVICQVYLQVRICVFNTCIQLKFHESMSVCHQPDVTLKNSDVPFEGWKCRPICR